MSKVGIDHPTSLDLVTMNELEVRLVLVENRALADADAPALQEKLNNYLSYALDGGLEAGYPEAIHKRVILRLDFYARPSAFISQFIDRFRQAVADHNVQVELSIEGIPVA